MSRRKGFHVHTASPNSSSACQVNLPSLSLMRHSSVLNSKTSPSSSVLACHITLCWIRARSDARAVWGLRDENLIIWESGRRPRVKRTDATVWNPVAQWCRWIFVPTLLTADNGPKWERVISIQRRVVWESAISYERLWTRASANVSSQRFFPRQILRLVEQAYIWYKRAASRVHSNKLLFEIHF